MEDRTPLFIVVGFYLVFLLGIAVYSYMRGRKAVQTGGQDAEVNEHFLASRSFGTAVLFLTTFSTIISGYTAFNIPSEVAGIGFIAFRWLQGFISIILGYVVAGPRYRRVATARNWQSPNDIIADKYNCNSLRLFGAFVQCFPMILYIAVQLISLDALIFQLSEGQISGDAGSWFLVIFIWICEVIGGFRGVSLTDAIQSGIMLIAFLGLPIMLGIMYGGFIGINEFPLCDQFRLEGSTPTGCVGIGKPFFNFYPPVGPSDVGEGGWQAWSDQVAGVDFSPAAIGFCQSITNTSAVPPATLAGCLTLLGTADAVDTQELFNYVPLGMLSFSIALSVAGLQPHWAQRIISAKSDLVVKKSLILTSTCIMFASIPGLMLGLTQVAVAAQPTGSDRDALPVMLGVFYDMGGFPAFFSVVISVAAVAAFMSTADSAAIGVSNVITVEVFQNFLTPNMSDKLKLVVAKLISLSVLVISRGILYAELDILTALNWQIGLGWAVLPTYAFALFGSDTVASAYSLLIGMFAHYILLFGLEFGVISGGGNVYLYSGIYCGIVNFAVTYVANKLLPERLKNDAERTGSDSVVLAARERFGGGKVDHLTAAKRAEIMSDTVEPVATKLGAFLVIGAVILLFFSFPWFGKPGWDSSFDISDPASLVAGMPQWAFNLTIMASVEFFMLIAALSMWKTHKMDVELKEIEAEKAEAATVKVEDTL